MTSNERRRLIAMYESIADKAGSSLKCYVDESGLLRHRPHDDVPAQKTTLRASLSLPDLASTEATNICNALAVGDDIFAAILGLEYLATHSPKQLTPALLSRIRKVSDSSLGAFVHSLTTKPNTSELPERAHAFFPYRLWKAFARIQNPDLRALLGDAICSCRSVCAAVIYMHLALYEAGETSSFDLGQLCFALATCVNTIPRGVAEHAIVVCAKEFSSRTQVGGEPYLRKKRDAFIAPRPEEAFVAMLEAAMDLKCYCDAQSDPVSAVYSALFHMELRTRVEYVDGGEKAPSGWASPYGDHVPEAWPTLAVCEMAHSALHFLRASVLYSLQDEFRFLVDSAREGVRPLSSYEEMPFGVYHVLQKHFVAPESRADAWSSAVLFGPPGTGKTSLVRSIAEALGWTFVQITPSDVAQDGPDKIISRMRWLLEGLSDTQRCVILLDEFDPFMLSRRESLKGSWGELITNCMLPLLVQLKESRRSMFFVATNRVNEIDPAATRSGRFDAILPIWPPSGKSREKVLANLKVNEDDLPAFTANTRFASYGQLESLALHGEQEDWEQLRATEEEYLAHLAFMRPRPDGNVRGFD